MCLITKRTILNEQTLIHGLQQGDEKMFSLMVETYQHMVFNTVLGLVLNYEEAEDLAQDVFVLVFQQIGSFRSASKFSTWLYTIAVRTALNHLRKQKAKKRAAQIKRFFGIEVEQEIGQADFYHPGVILENKEYAAVLFKALQQLPENQRIAFLLVKTEEMRYDEVAEILGVSVKGVEGLMHRAKENLRIVLKDYYKS